MTIKINLDILLLKRKMTVTELSERLQMDRASLSEFKNGRSGGIRLTTLAKLCHELNCQPGDILEYVPEGEDKDS